jgi:hypothetical protein
MRIARAPRLALAIAAAFVASGQTAQEPAESPFRRDLRRSLRAVIRAAPLQFKSIQGVRIDIHPGRETWYDARYPLPDATDCRVYEQPPQYICRWEKSTRRPNLGAFFTALAADVEAALGERWKRAGTADKDAAIRFEEAREGGATIVLAPARRASNGAVQLTVTGGVRPRPR